MSDSTLSQAARRVQNIAATLTGSSKMAGPSIPFNPESTTFPTLAQLPIQPGAPTGAAWVWGADDNRGRLNLLTPTRIAAAAKECIQTGESARLDLPLHLPLQPAFGRCVFQHTIKPIHEGVAYDDEYTLNTQSGTQWDGFRHVGHAATGTFYNGGRASDFRSLDANGAAIPPSSSSPQTPPDNLRNSIHHWSSGNGFSGRAILLDYRRYAASKGIKYDSSTSHPITLTELRACAHHQNGLDLRPVSQGGHVRPGDILLLRTGWTEDYHTRSSSQNAALATREGDAQKLVGVHADDDMVAFLHDCWFAAVGGDQPAWECWPPNPKCFLHEYLLALWGVPIGEMLDLERASEICERLRRWVFFFTSAPARCEGGVGSHVNGTGIW
jgi:hypothetical protein